MAPNPAPTPTSITSTTQRRTYELTRGRHSRLEGGKGTKRIVYGPRTENKTIELTDEEAVQFGDRVRLASVVGPSPPNAALLPQGQYAPMPDPNLPDVNKNLRETKAAKAGAGAFTAESLGDETVPNVVARIADLDANALTDLRKFETAGKNRKGILDAIEAREQELESGQE